MNSVPNNSYTASHDTNHPSLLFTPRQLEPQNREAPAHINDLFSNDLLNFGDFKTNTGAVPTPPGPPHGTLPRQVNHLVRRRRLANIQRRGQVRPGAIPRGSRSQTAGFDALPLPSILPLRMSIDSLDGPHPLNTHPSASLSAGPSSTMFDGGVPRYHVGPGVLVPQVSSPSDGFPQSHAAVAPQLTIGVFDGTFDPITQPSTSRPSGQSPALFDNMTSGLVPGMAPTLASSASLNWLTPTPKLAVRPWDANTASMGTAAFAAAAAATTTGTAAPSVRAEPRQVPVSRCTCCKRVHPLVRVNDTIEWVRPDVMKMVLYFNWSQNADAEAHEPWEPHGL